MNMASDRVFISKRILCYFLGAILLGHQQLLPTSHSNSVQAFGSLADLISDSSSSSDQFSSLSYDDDVRTIVQQSRLVNKDQFKEISNDVELFHRAMEKKLVKLGPLLGNQIATTNEEEELKLLEQLEEADNKALTEHASPGLFARIKQAARDVIAPARSYYELIKRYQEWRNDWNQLRAELGPRPGESASGQMVLASALDVLRLEYARLDNELMSELCFKDNARGEEAKQNEDKNENVDFIVKVLRRLIERLVKKLDMTRGKSSSELLAEEASEHDELERAESKCRELERSVQVASDRAKRIAARSVANLAAQEFIAVMKLLAFDTLATFVSNHKGNSDGPSGFLSRMEPIVLLLGKANTPLLISYMRNIQFRATLNLVNYSFTKIQCPF